MSTIAKNMGVTALQGVCYFQNVSWVFKISPRRENTGESQLQNLGDGGGEDKRQISL